MKLLLFFAAVVGGMFLASPYFYYWSPLHTSIKKAVAVIRPTKGNTVNGLVIFAQEADGVHVVATCQDAKPGKHGFHIHEIGDCGCDDAKCAGDHFNPTKQAHGGPNSAVRHAGDMGNIIVGDDGHGRLEYIDHVIKLDGPNSIVGRSVIMHTDEDDLKTQPTGNSGARIGCGSIGLGLVK